MMLSALNWITHATAWATQDDDTLLSYNPDDVTPGVLGFGFTALFALVIILLGLDMYRRVRRVRYREEIRQEIAAEIAAGTDPANGTLGDHSEQSERDSAQADGYEGRDSEDSADPRDR